MFQNLIFNPMYNLLVYIVSVVPGHVMWVSVVITTFIIKAALVPLYKRQVRDQVIMQHINPKVKNIQEKYLNKTSPEDKQEMTKEILALYKEHKTNPLLSIIILFIQLPILFALYRIFLTDISVHAASLYDFVKMSEGINTYIFGIGLGLKKSVVFAVLAGGSQYLLGTFMFNNKNAFGENEFAQAMQLQMKYFLPFFMVMVSYFTPVVVAIYIISSNLFMLLQEVFIKRPLEKRVKLELK